MAALLVPLARATVRRLPVVHTVAAAAGLGALLASALAALDVIRIGGAVVLLFLAVANLRAARYEITPVAGRSPRRTFVSAVLTNLANPKVVLFYVAFVPQFITAGGWAASVQILVLGTVLFVIGLLMDTILGLAAGTFSTMLLSRPAIQRWLSGAAAVVFGGLALRLLLTDNR